MIAFVGSLLLLLAVLLVTAGWASRADRRNRAMRGGDTSPIEEGTI